MRIALIGFGEVGQTLAQDLSGHDLAAYDINPAKTAGAAILIATSAPDAVAGAELVISAVTAAQTLAAAQSVGPLARNAVFLDLNSASPGQKIAAFEAVQGRYVEASVMAPIGPKRIASPILLGGPHAADAAPMLHKAGFTGATVFSDQLGKASAAKLCRSVIIKGVEALITESMLSARHYGVEDHVLKSLSDLLPVGDWEALAKYMIERSVEHGTRRAEEMEEAARTVGEAGVEPLMSLAIARRQAWAAGHLSALPASDLDALLDAVRGEAKA